MPDQMTLDPSHQAIATDGPVRHTQNQVFGFIDARVQVVAIEEKERRHSGMADPLVAVNERMIPNQREPQRRGLGRERRIRIHTAGARARLRDRRLEASQISEARGSPSLCNEAAVQLYHLPECEVPHSGKPSIQRFVGRENLGGSAFEILRWPCEEIAHSGGCQITQRNV